LYDRLWRYRGTEQGGFPLSSLWVISSITFHTTEMKSLTDQERGKPPCSVPLYLHNLSYNRDEITHRWRKRKATLFRAPISS
jgi:hypothetical protein